MAVKEPQVGWGFWLWWVLASTAGWGSGFTLAFLLLTSTFLLPTIFAAGLSALVGLAQWLVLRRRMILAGWWVWASVVGGIMGWAGGSIVFPALDRAVSIALLEALGWPTVWFAIIGAIVGVTQWLLLRQQFSRAGLWILASTVGWAAFGLTLWLGNLVMETVFGALFESLDYILSFVMGGLLAGAITGTALVWLLRHPFGEAQKG